MGFLRGLGVEIVFAGLALTSTTVLLGSEPAPASVPALIVRLAVHLLVAATLVFAVTRSAASGPALAAALFLTFAASWVVGGEVEVVALEGRSIGAMARPVMLGSAVAAVVTTVVLLVMGRMGKGHGSAEPWAVAPLLGGLAWALPFAIAYAVLTGLAALLLRPMLAESYQHFPSTAMYAAAELARGFIFTAAALPLLLTMQGRRWKNALALGALLAGTGAGAPLLRFVGEIPWGVLAGQAAMGAVVTFALGAGLARAVLPPMRILAAGQPAAARRA